MTSYVQYVQDSQTYHMIDPWHKQNENIYFVKSEMRLKDNYWDLFELAEHELYFFEKSYSRYYPSYISPTKDVADREYVSVYLRADNKMLLYKREEYDLLTYFGDIGGLLDFVFLFGWAVSTAFVTRLLHASLIKSAYRVQ